MSYQHTPEPWNYAQEGKDAFGIVEPDGTSILHAQALTNSTGARCLEANARRIVACVNACAELPQDALDGGWTALGMSRHARNVEEQRDELLTKHQVACDTIERQRADIDAIRGYLDAMKGSCERTGQQRDELMAALIHIQQVACSGSPEIGIATEAIAKLKQS